MLLTKLANLRSYRTRCKHSLIDTNALFIDLLCAEIIMFSFKFCFKKFIWLFGFLSYSKILILFITDQSTATKLTQQIKWKILASKEKRDVWILVFMLALLINRSTYIVLHAPENVVSRDRSLLAIVWAVMAMFWILIYFLPTAVLVIELGNVWKSKIRLETGATV